MIYQIACPQCHGLGNNGMTRFTHGNLSIEERMEEMEYNRSCRCHVCKGQGKVKVKIVEE